MASDTVRPFVASPDSGSMNWWLYAVIGAAWFLGSQALSFGGVETEAPYRWITAGAFAAFGAACGWNAKNCGRIHCRINAPAYLLIALVTAATALGLFDLGMGILLGAFIAVTAASFTIERWMARARGDGTAADDQVSRRA